MFPSASKLTKCFQVKSYVSKFICVSKLILYFQIHNVSNLCFQVQNTLLDKNVKNTAQLLREDGKRGGRDAVGKMIS